MSQHSPPRWMMKFFRWFCREELCDAVEGDMLVLYQEQRQHRSRFRANLWYFFNVLTFLQSFAIKRRGVFHHLNPFNMFFNNLKIGFRLMRKHKTYSAINVMGLAIALSAVMLMALFIKDELSYDRFNSKGKDVVRLSHRQESPNTTQESARLPFAAKQAIAESYPEIDKITRFYYWSEDTPLLAYEGQNQVEQGVYFTEPDVFEIFDFEWISGNPATALSDPRSIVLTEKMALKYFGHENPMGKTMRFKNNNKLVVTGLLKDIPQNSHITFDFLLPLELQRQMWLGWDEEGSYDLERDWNHALGVWTYALLAPGTDLALFEDKLQMIAEEHLNKDGKDEFSIQVQPLFDIHLNSDKLNEARANGNMVQLYGLGAIAILILVIACINFINLTSAQANKRFKEVGLRKVMGAKKTELVSQFLAEALILVSLASTIALIIANVTLPYFNQFMGKSLSIRLEELPFLSVFVVLVVVIALLSSLRPSMAAVRISAIQGLVNTFNLMRSKQRFSRFMVIGQFMVCNLLIIGILVINNQLDLLRNKDLGFDKSEMIILKHSRYLRHKDFGVLQNQLSALPVVQNVNRGYVAGTKSFNGSFGITRGGSEDMFSLGVKWVGEGFNEMFDIQLIEGRNFDESSDTNIESAILINAAAAREFGWSVEESIGQKLSYHRGSRPEVVLNIIGVLEDANFESLYDPIVPSVFRRNKSSVGNEVVIKLNNTNDLHNTLNKIEAAWTSIMLNWPFEFSFLDEQIEAQYAKEEKLSAAIKYFAILAVFIAFLGLFGLASFAVQERTKEIGVRKVLGASTASLFSLVSKRFLWAITASFLLAAPIGYYLFDQWLQDFAYQVQIGPAVFLTAGIMSLVVALIAVGFKSLKAASRNPVNTLRYE